MTSQRYVWAWQTTVTTAVVSATLATSALMGCAGTPQARRTSPHEIPGSSSREVPDAARGFDLQMGIRLGLDHTLHVHRSKNDGLHVLHDDDTVRTGDRIRVSVQTSEEAYLYLAFCSHQKLTVYPSPHGIRTHAGELLFVPQGSADLVVDENPGDEVLYVIASRTELSLADPNLAQALAAQRPSNTPVDCVTSLDPKVAKLPNNAGAGKPQTPDSANVLRRVVPLRKPQPSRHAYKDHRAPNPTLSNLPAKGFSSPDAIHPSVLSDATPPTQPPKPGLQRPGSQLNPGASPGNPPPEPDFERNPGNIGWRGANGAADQADMLATDESNIVVVRHTFMHRPQASPP